MIIVSSILAFGLFCLMVWRLLATLHDRREFAKFEQEREKAKWETVGDDHSNDTETNSRCLGC
jgi:integrin beta 3